MFETTVFKALAENIEEGAYLVDRERTFLMWNLGAEKISGYTAEEMLGRHCQDDLLDHVDERGTPLCNMSCPLYKTMADGELRHAEVLLRHKNGHRIPVAIKAIPIFEGGEIVAALEIFSPLSGKQYDDRIIAALSLQATTDVLTGLPNRLFMENYLDYKLQEYARFGNSFCVIFIDVDNFAHFNNTYGHALGDEVLKNISNNMQQNLRRTDRTGRWGGEEFLAVANVGPGEKPETIASKIFELICSARIVHNGISLSVTVSMGVTAVRPGDTRDDIVARADSFMYYSKTSGKDCICVEGACYHPF